MNDRPERLAGIVGLDRHPAQAVGRDPVAPGRCGLVLRRLPAQRVPALAGGTVADDDPARPVRVLAASVLDQRLDHRGGNRHGRRPRRPGHHQLIPPSSSSPISSRSRLYVPADRYFHPPSGSSTTTVPDRIWRISRAAATSTAPEDGPAKMPSRKTRSRSAASDSRLETRNFATSTSGSRISGTKPSSSERRPWTFSPGSGSAATTRTPGLRSLR